jgi:5-methyltetrahydropteroyltriglutamate--homocysteine methyltransferase
MSGKDDAILLTSVVGSYPQPDWLVDKDVLRGQYVPRVRIEKLWRVPREQRDAAIRDATLLAIRDQEAAGIDVITDGETARESYSNHFVMGLDGIDVDDPATITSRIGHQVRVPRVIGPVRHRGTVELVAASFLRSHTRHRAKITIPGPFTLAQQVKDEYYGGDRRALALDFAAAVNAEARALEATGIDVIQVDEPWLRNDPEGARAYGVEALDRALEGLTVRKALHMCFGYAFLRSGHKPSSYEYLAELAGSRIDEISIEAAQPNLDLSVLAELKNKSIALGVLDHSTAEPEGAETVAARIRAGLKHLSPERLMPSPDCGMKYMTREAAFARLKGLADGAALVRRELS